MPSLVIVESPAKAKTINKYLGSDYHVLASFGHVRDLPSKEGSVKPECAFEMLWEVQSDKEKHLREIVSALKSADTLILATDPDREGEAISWHLTQELTRRKALKGVSIQRVVFHEITRHAVLEAMKQPRNLDQDLVEAYLARRALDYLVGFTLSPILWRKLPGSRSAGRVQSVALRLICERENEISRFQPREYWTVAAMLETEKEQNFTARLVALDGKKLGKFDLPDEPVAHAARDRVSACALKIISVEKKQLHRHPQSPFTTSTLQQEAARKLGFGATRTMRTAQKLYEGIALEGETVGLITYMRTDGVQISQDAIAEIRPLIEQEFGISYLPKTPRAYSAKAKNAQEAHEAIRPTSATRHPATLTHYLDQDQLRLYELIWKRTLASQMNSALLDQVVAEIGTDDVQITLRATGTTIAFDGFLKLYQEGVDDPEDQEGDKAKLPPLVVGQALNQKNVAANQHFTQPPPRYSEASLVKKLEELGIGRPSTYASILQVLQDRNYVRFEAKRFTPEDRGQIVSTFLTAFFERYIQYEFTANLEEQLDDISGGRANWKIMLEQFWRDFSTIKEKETDETQTLIGMSQAIEDLNQMLGRTSEVLDRIDAIMGPHFFPPNGDAAARVCPICPNRTEPGRLGLKLGRFGGFIGCSHYPDCRYTRQLGDGKLEDGAEGNVISGPVILGTDPLSQLPVSLRKGPYGPYVQLGPMDLLVTSNSSQEESKPEAIETPQLVEGKVKGRKSTKKSKETVEKPKRVSLPKGLVAADVTFETALKLLALPREIGIHPESNKPIYAGLGRYGAYLRHDGVYISLSEPDDVIEIGMNRAVERIAQAKMKGGRQAPAGTILGAHPIDSEAVTLHTGRYGPYVKHGVLLASLPRGQESDGFSLDDAVALLAEKGKPKGSGRTNRSAKPTQKTAAAKKATTAKKTTTAKTTTAKKETRIKKTTAKTVKKNKLNSSEISGG